MCSPPAGTRVAAQRSKPELASGEATPSVPNVEPRGMRKKEQAGTCFRRSEPERRTGRAAEGYANMSKRLGQTPFFELLPHSIAADQTVRRIADALDAPLDRLARAIPDLLLFSRLGHDAGTITPARLLPPLERLAALSGALRELPEDVVDMLAWQLHVERYETAASLAAKRAMVFASVILHRKRGTPWAVKYGLETTLQVPAEIAEWFEYGGEPYFFRVTLDVSGTPVDARALENAVKVIFAHKNVRSWLEYLRTKATRRLPFTIGAAAVHQTSVQAFTWRWPFALESLPARAGTGLCGKSLCQSSLVNRQPEPGEMSPHPAFTAYSFTRSKICPRL